jgi:hypothetical protein
MLRRLVCGHGKTMTIRFLAAAMLLVLASRALGAAEPVALPPAMGLTEGQAKQRTALFAGLATAKNEADAREIEDRIWTFWRSFADAQSRQLLEDARQAELRFDYAEAILDQSLAEGAEFDRQGSRAQAVIAFERSEHVPQNWNRFCEKDMLKQTGRAG